MSNIDAVELHCVWRPSSQIVKQGLRYFVVGFPRVWEFPETRIHAIDERGHSTWRLHILLENPPQCLWPYHSVQIQLGSCSRSRAYSNVVFIMVMTGLFPKVDANSLADVIHRTPLSSYTSSFSKTNTVLSRIVASNGQRYKHSSSQPKQDSNVPTTIRKSTSVVEHIV